jgi:hypothetical protein
MVTYWQRVAAGETATGMLGWKTSTGIADQPGVFWEPKNASNYRLYVRRAYGSAIDVGDNRGNWHLVLYEFVNGTTTHRVMGMGVVANDSTFSAESVAAASNNVGFYVGGPDATIYMNGQISSPCVWSRILTADERTDLYNAGAGLFY